MSSPFLIRLRGTSSGIVDLAGNTWTNNDGVTVGNVELVTGGYAIDFSSGGYLSTPSDSKFNIAEGQDFTLSLKMINTANDDYPLLIGTMANGIEQYDSQQPCLCGALAGARTPYYYYINGSYITSNKNYQANEVVHIAVVRKDGVITLYLNGESVASVNNSSIQDFGRKDVMIGYGGLWSGSHFHGKLDDICLLNIAVWDSDFTPPTSYLSLNQVIYLSGQEAWGINGSGDFAKLSNNYSAMTSAEKIAMFDATDRQVPTIAQLKTLTMPIKAVSYNDENEQPSCTVTAIPTPQTVTPKGRISLKNYAKLQGVSITGATSGNGAVKVAVTKDNSTYQVYDTTNLAWVDINIADIGTDGMSLSDVAALTTAEWLAYDCMDSGIGFAYYLEMASTSDTAYTDELTLNVELLGELKSLVKGTDYDYSYVSNDVLQVKLFKNGDFRINYNPGES